MTEDARVCLETCTPRREAGAMEWILLADVEFAESQHGYYFVYKKIDHLAVGRWFADYEERNNFPESGEQRFRLCGLSSIEEARRECEKHAIKLGPIIGKPVARVFPASPCGCHSVRHRMRNL